MTYLLGIDIGTSACKVALFDTGGDIVAQEIASYAVHYPRPGFAQQNPNDWWDSVCGCLRRLTQRVKPDEIAGIGVDGQSWSCILIGERGEALSDTPIWMDTRAQAQCADMRRIIGDERLFSVCGNPVTPSYALPKLMWYRDEMPEVYGKAARVLGSNSFIAYRLTGITSQDLSQGYGFQCFNMRKGQWDRDTIRELGIREELFPDIVGCSDIIGTVTKEAAALTGLAEGTAVVAGGLDAACATLGVGVIDAGQAQEQGGQAGGMSLCLSSYTADPALILSRHVAGGRWLLQGGTVGGGGALKWLREKLFPELTFEQLSDMAAQAPPGSDGLLFLPYMAGERSPIWNPDATGVFMGLDYTKTRAHMARAVMEGVAFSLKNNLEVAKAAGAEAKTLNATGGSANSLVWTQIKADVTGCRIDVPASDTATTWGAAMLAGVGTGVIGGFEEAVRDTVSIKRTHVPNEKNRRVYETAYQRYMELYERLEPMMKGSGEGA